MKVVWDYCTFQIKRQEADDSSERCAETGNNRPARTSTARKRSANDSVDKLDDGHQILQRNTVVERGQSNIEVLEKGRKKHGELTQERDQPQCQHRASID
jgi:hypothetical protein